uniref:Inositol hexakisphosphate and diphosphoinositol-pentakisphosphate kinase n=1 Tax=Propithecus coquereli TaxID=379532 RepID=A0A2K6FGS6_PROCO
MSEAPRFFVGPEDTEINPGNYRHFFHHADEDDDEDDESPPERQIVVGICSMAKKSKSKPMKEILERISLFKYITVVVFEEEVILNEPVENWPLCDCLISFHSKVFTMKNKFVMNSLNVIFSFFFRREVYSILQAEGILLPRYAILNRDPNNPKGKKSNVRKTGSYIYEEFMPTDGTDVKVGLITVEFNFIFQQTVCGFDLLRANGQSYVCDVNGFSFVKNSMKYYDDCAKILGNIVMRELAPQFHIPWSIPLEAEDIPIVPTTSGTMMELRCVIAVIRHGDRTPKQKMKMEVRHQKFFDLFEKCDGYKSGKLKLKNFKFLLVKLHKNSILLLDIARQLLMELGQNNDSEIEENKPKLEQLKTVLEILIFLLYHCRDYAGFPGCGLLRLHSTYRHDLKIYASDEGRVQMTAAAFAKGLLALEGELTPILVQMVKSANMNGLLDSDSDSLSSCQQRVKARLHEILQKDRDFTAEDYEKLTPSGSISLVKSMHLIKNPVKTCDKVYSLIQSLTSQIRHRMEDPKSSDIQLYHSETLELMLRRWSKLEKDFKTKNGRYDISKIPDIYDCIKYDVQHNGSLKLENTMELYRLSKALADIVIPQEYGITKAEKLEIAKGYCTPLVRKIRSDLQRTQDDDTVNKLHPVYSRGVLSPERHVRTRLYFTSESHVHSLLSILRYGALCNESKDEQWKRAMDYLNVVNELNYMTQIVIMLYEDPNKDLSSEERFHVELHFSPGAKGCEEDKNLPSGYGYRPASRENEGRRSFKIDNDDEPHTSKKDEVDRAVILFKPMVSEPIHIHRKSPLPRSRKMTTNEEESPLSVSSPEGTGTWLHYTSGVGTGRRRRRSGEQITSSPVSPKSLAFTSSIFGSWQQVVSENANYLRTARTLVEQKQNPTVGSHCAGLFSTSVLGGSSSAPNLQDYARTHRKKLTSSGCIDDATRGSAVKRFSISFARHPTNGFELYSMVPSICPLETLHNALSLKQVDEFLASIASPSSDVPRKTPESSSTALRSTIVCWFLCLFCIATSGPSGAVVSNTSSRKKNITSKTEMHEHKKNTGKKK